MLHDTTIYSNVDDYRSVIDDLTIENKRLREKLRRYEKLHSSHLEKDKLFEVKIHSLPPVKRKELEDALRSFVSGIDATVDRCGKAKPKLGHANYTHHLHTPGRDTNRHFSKPASNPRPVDSAYASMSQSGPTSTSTQNTGPLERRSKIPGQATKEQNIQSFLHDIPEGLLPRHSIMMTERQKKKLVVKRLEQLFTGKVKGIIASHNQALQQQEVSKSAARADQARDHRSAEEGLREAHILPHKTEIEQIKPSGLSNKSSQEIVSPALSNPFALETSDRASLPDQRPTRPLDLDPDREQIPSDNVEYIRHLGLSTPQLVAEDSSDAEPDADGWIYLNLLMNMAQLHIMNVTPDFVRTAVSDVSARFQLSKDGKKIRWRGGKDGTRLSSDSDSSNPYGKRQQESDSESESIHKRRKLEGSSKVAGQFASIALKPQDPVQCAAASDNNKFHYKPLFHHTSSRDDLISVEDDGTNSGTSIPGTSRTSRGRRARGHGSRSTSSKQRADDGPIVFYSGAKFYTDLSGDRANILTPLHTASVVEDGFSTHAQGPLGCAFTRPVSTFFRTPSGSLMQSRPFKNNVVADFNLVSTPEVTSDNASGSDELNLDFEWSSRPSPESELLELRASGLGGTQPADHFAVSVHTRRTKLGIASQGNISRYLRKHSIPSGYLDAFREDKSRQIVDDITNNQASMDASSPPFQDIRKVDLLVKTEIIGTKISKLPPSELPKPSAYYEAMSTSDGDYDSISGETSSSGISEYRRPVSFYYGANAMLSQPDIQSPPAIGRNMDASGSDDEEGDDNSDDSSIDMLAPLRAFDPESVAVQEKEFEMQSTLPIGPSAITVTGQDALSSLQPDNGSKDSDDDECI
jgi:hypothetical protein